MMTMWGKGVSIPWVCSLRGSTCVTFPVTGQRTLYGDWGKCIWTILPLFSVGLIRWSHDPNVSVPQMAGLLLERSQNESWIVVFKALISTHTLMNYGSEVCLMSKPFYHCFQFLCNSVCSLKSPSRLSEKQTFWICNAGKQWQNVESAITSLNFAKSVSE